MTIVAVWYEPTDCVVWAVADTRVSSPGSGGGLVVRTDSATKILSVPVVCSYQNRDPNYHNIPYYSTSWGFAYAGDVLPAISTYSVASTFLQKLVAFGSQSVGGGDGNPISILDAAKLFARLGAKYSKEALHASNFAYGRFEAVLFGWCPVSDGFRICRLSALGSPDFEMKIEIVDPVLNSQPVVLGKKDLFYGRYEARSKEGDKYGRTVRMPKSVIEEIVRDQAGDVGGALSIAFSTKSGLELMGWTRPVKPGFPEAVTGFNGIDLDGESRFVGSCFVGLMSIC